MPDAHSPQSDLDFAAGCALPLSPRFVEFAASARRLLAAQLRTHPATLRAEHPFTVDFESIDAVELVMAAEEELSFAADEADLPLLQAPPPHPNHTIGAFIHGLFQGRLPQRPS